LAPRSESPAIPIAPLSHARSSASRESEKSSIPQVSEQRLSAARSVYATPVRDSGACADFLEQLSLTVDGGQQWPWFLIDHEQLMKLIEKNAVPKGTSAPPVPVGVRP
jgi:hypothetical protein